MFRNRELLESILRDVQRGFGDYKSLRDEITVIYKRTAALADGQDKLMQSHAAIKADLDAWATMVKDAFNNEQWSRIGVLSGMDARLSVIETKLCEVMEGNAARAEWMAQLSETLGKPNGKSATGKRSR